MATKIIKEQSVWNPVKIEIDFETPEQLAAFVVLYGNNTTVARTVTKAVNSDDLSDLYGLTVGTFSRAIESTINYDTWEHLRDILINRQS